MVEVKIPDLVRQHEKTPAWVRRVRRILDDDGKEQTIIERVVATEGTGVTVKILRWHEALAKIRDYVQNRTLTELKDLYKDITDSSYDGVNSKLGVVKAILKFWFDAEAGATLSEADALLEAEAIKQGRWGLGCPHACGRFWEFKPMDTGFDPIDAMAYTGKQAVILDQFTDESGNIHYLIEHWSGQLMWVTEVPVNRGYLEWDDGKFLCDRCGGEVRLIQGP